MPPKGKSKKGGGPKKGCLRCPTSTDEVMRCSQTLRCKNATGEYADLDNLWPGFPSDPESSFARKTNQDCERLLVAAETRKDYIFEDITKQMLEQALKILQDKGKPKAPKPIAGPSTASSSKTPATPAVETVEPEPEANAESPRTPPEGPSLSSFNELTLKERQDPFAKLMHSAKLGRSVATPLRRPQTRLEIDMPRREGLPQSTGPSTGNPVDCRQAWSKQLQHIEKQRDSLDDSFETYALRPGFANTESGVLVRSNHFVVDLDPKKELYEFEILGIPDSAGRAKKRDLVETMMLNCPVLRDQPDEYATDYKKKIIAWKDLFVWHAKEDPEESRTITLPGRPGPQGQPTDTVLRLNFVRKLSVKDLVDYVQGKQITFANTGVIEALNILISKGVSEADAQSIEVGTNRFYYKPGHSPLTDGLVAIRGYFASIRPGMGNVLLNVNTVMGAFYEPIRVDLLLEKFRGDKRRAERFLKGVRVRIMYNRARPIDAKGKQSSFKDSRGKLKAEEESIDSERRRTKSIWSIGQVAEQQTFEKDGRRVGVLNYLRETYPQIRITKTKLFCINLGNDAQPSWFLAEHLHILPYQLYKSKLDPTQVAEMIKHACRDPDTNRMLIMEEGLPSIGITATLPRVLAQTNMRINRNMLDVPGFSIPMPIVQTSPKPAPGRSAPRPSTSNPDNAPKNSIDISRNAAFGYHWEMIRSKPLITTKQYRPQTHLIYVDQNTRLPPQQRTLTSIVGEFNREIPPYGFGHLQLTSENSTMLHHTGATTAGIKTGLDNAVAKKADLVVLLLPSSGSADANAYRFFKSQADQVYGFKTITMAEDKIMKGGLAKAMRNNSNMAGCLKYYMSGVALKLNLKLGNWNWEVGGDELRKALRQPIGARFNTLVLGADVTHPSATSVAGCPSIAAVVGNVDVNCGRMPGSMRMQTPRNEMIEALDSMVEERLLDWNATNRSNRISNEYALPERILYYRDGVSESQYAAIKALEIPQIRAGWARARTKTLAMGNTGLHVPSDVRITCVLVSKRHNTRFYPSPASHPLSDTPQNERAKGKGNLKPGVVIESVVTSPYWHDFYLNSHFGLQGTVRPAHYIVLEDENHMSAGGLQRLTFQLCHLYQRAMCSVSYVTPTYYADRLCERGRHYLAEFFDGGVDVRGLTEEGVRGLLERAWFRGAVGAGGAGTAVVGEARKNPWHKNLDGTMFWL